jgi:hypothetical protein
MFTAISIITYQPPYDATTLKASLVTHGIYGLNHPRSCGLWVPAITRLIQKGGWLHV